jgi:uncharacterized protein YjbJ (UPF0337 family)
MNWDRIEGHWKQVTGRAKEQWGKLTDDDLNVVAGRRDQLVGKIQERYGLVKDEAERQLSEWSRHASDAWFPKDATADAKAEIRADMKAAAKAVDKLA